MDIFNSIAAATRPVPIPKKVPFESKINLSKFKGKRSNLIEYEGFVLNGFMYCVLYEPVLNLETARYNKHDIHIMEISRCPINYKEYLTMTSISIIDFQKICDMCEDHWIKTSDYLEWLINEIHFEKEYRKNIGNERY